MKYVSNIVSVSINIIHEQTNENKNMEILDFMSLFEKSAILGNKIDKIVCFCKNKNVNDWINNTHLPLPGMDILLSIDNFIECLKFINVELMLTLFEQTISTITQSQCKYQGFSAYLRASLICIRINLFTLTSARNLIQSECDEIDMSGIAAEADDFSLSYVRYNNTSFENTQLVCLYMRFIVWIQMYDLKRKDKQKINLIGTIEEITKDGSTNKIQEVLQCKDLARYLCEFV